MGDRQMSNTPQMFRIERDHDQWHGGTTKRSHINMGMTSFPENVSTYPMENVLINGVQCAPQWELGGRPVEHSLASVRPNGLHPRSAIEGTSYDPFPPVGNFSVAPESASSISHSTFYNRHNIPGGGGFMLHHSMGSGTGQWKRKNHVMYAACERGSSSRLSVAECYSSPSEILLQERISCFDEYSSSSTSLHHYRSGSHSVDDVDSLRNVRSRSRLDLRPNQRRIDLPSYSSIHCYPMNLRDHTGSTESTNLNVNGVVHENHRLLFPTAQRMLLGLGNSGLSHEVNRFPVGGGSEIGGYFRDPISRRNLISHPPLHDFQAAAEREGPSYHPSGGLPSYTTDLGFPHMGETFPSENSLHFPSEAYSSRYASPLCTGGWGHGYRDARSRIAADRFRYGPNVADAYNTYNTVETEALTVLDQSSLYNSMYLFDQYQEMMLDIDNMSYEELLSLGERIGNVDTGLSQDAITECLKTKYYASYYRQEAANCAICLEDYRTGEKVGKLKNCGHEYHGSCITKWLSIKNMCPICKGPALAEHADISKDR